MLFKFKNVIFEDVVRKMADGSNDWSQVCQHCVDKYDLHEYKKLNSIPIDSICGVEGCQNDADYYIDFKDGELEETERKFYVFVAFKATSGRTGKISSNLTQEDAERIYSECCTNPDYQFIAFGQHNYQDTGLDHDIKWKNNKG